LGGSTPGVHSCILVEVRSARNEAGERRVRTASLCTLCDDGDDEAIPDESEALSRWVSELTALSTLSAAWTTSDPQEIAEELGLVLLRSLPVAFAYARLHGPAGVKVEVVRTRDGPQDAHQAREIGETLEPLLKGGGQAQSMANPFGSGTLRVVVVPIGWAGDCGVLVAGSSHVDFPSEADRLLLGVAANQAAVVLQHQVAEQTLRESEQRFARFMQNLPGLAWIKDSEGRYVYANEAAEKAFRRSSAQLYGRTDEEVFPPETAAKFKENDRQALSGPSGLQTVEALVHDDGILHHSVVSKFSIPGKDGTPALIGGMALDITARLRVEDALREREEQFRALFEQTTGGIAQTDLLGHFVLVNDRYCQIVGRSREELMGLRMQDITHRDDLQRNLKQFEDLVAGRATDFTIEKRYVRPDGSAVWVNNSVSLVRDSMGQPQFALAAVTDVTERVRAEITAQESSRQKDAFLAVLGHELRNPLSPMLTALQLMRLRGVEGREVEILEQQVGHMRRLVDDLLDVSRITSGKILLRMEELDLAAVVARAIDGVGPLLEQRHQRLHVQIPKGTFGVRADPVRLTQVVTNLLVNAAKYSDEGSNIIVVARNDEDMIRLSVRDQGIGIAPEMLDTIFDDFVQRPESLDRSRDGLGLGLAIVRSLVHQHGGRVSARSDGVGKGSEFVVELPAVAVPEQTPATLTPAHPRRALGARERILVVDDNRDAAETLHDGLVNFGYVVEVAFDGASALKIAKEFRPVVALLDIGMPVMNGYELAGRLRGLGELTESIRLVAVTGFGQPGDKERALAAGFDRHLVKPVDLKTLTRVIEDLRLQATLP